MPWRLLATPLLKHRSTSLDSVFTKQDGAAAIKQRLKVQTASQRLADTNRKLAGGVDAKPSFAQMQARDLQKQRTVMELVPIKQTYLD